MENQCIFCKIVVDQMKAYVVYEDKSIIAFLDIRPRNPGHTLVIPKAHIETIFQMDEKMFSDIYKVVSRLAPIIVKAVGANGVNTIQSNIVSQGVNHFHTHVLPRFFNDGIPIVWEGGRVAADEELGIVETRIKSLMKG